MNVLIKQNQQAPLRIYAIQITHQLRSLQKCVPISQLLTMFMEENLVGVKVKLRDFTAIVSITWSRPVCTGLTPGAQPRVMWARRPRTGPTRSPQPTPGGYRDHCNNGEILTRRHEPVLTVSDRMSEARHEARLGFARSLPADLLLLLLLLLLRLCGVCCCGPGSATSVSCWW